MSSQAGDPPPGDDSSTCLPASTGIVPLPSACTDKSDSGEFPAGTPNPEDPQPCLKVSSAVTGAAAAATAAEINLAIDGASADASADATTSTAPPKSSLQPSDGSLAEKSNTKAKRITQYWSDQELCFLQSHAPEYLSIEGSKSEFYRKFWSSFWDAFPYLKDDATEEEMALAPTFTSETKKKGKKKQASAEREKLPESQIKEVRTLSLLMCCLSKVWFFYRKFKIGFAIEKRRINSSQRLLLLHLRSL